VVARRGFPTFPEDPQQALLVVGLGAWALNALNAARRRAEVREVEERVEAQRRERMEERKKKAYLARRKDRDRKDDGRFGVFFLVVKWLVEWCRDVLFCFSWVDGGVL